MKICVFTDSYLPYISGVTSAIVGQTNELASRGHEITIFCSTLKKEIKKLRNIHKNIKIIKVPFSFPVPVYKDFNFALPSVIKSAYLIKKFKPDVIHAHTEFGIGWEGLICARLFNLPIIGTFHTFFADPGYLKLIKAQNVEFIRDLIWKNSVSFFNHCNHVVSPSKKTKKELIKLGVTSPLTAVSNGISLPKLITQKKLKTLKKKHKITKKFNLIYVGRVGVEKSLDIVLKSLKLVLSSGHDIDLIIIGDGPNLNNTKDLVDKLGIKNNVKFLGRIPHTKLIKNNILRLGDAFITASKTENQPVSLIEAMAFGLPIIGVDARGVPELARNNFNGLISKPDNHKALSKNILKLIENKKLQKEMSNNAFVEAKTHDITFTGDKLEKIYNNAIDKYKEKKTRFKLYNLKQKVQEKFHQISSRFSKQ